MDSQPRGWHRSCGRRGEFYRAPQGPLHGDRAEQAGGQHGQVLREDLAAAGGKLHYSWLSGGQGNFGTHEQEGGRDQQSDDQEAAWDRDGSRQCRLSHGAGRSVPVQRGVPEHAGALWSAWTQVGSQAWDAVDATSQFEFEEGSL